MITKEYLREVLDYNPETGIFTTRVDTKHHRAGDEVGFITGKGYVRISVPGMKDLQYQAHRLAFMYMLGAWPECVDHVNGARDDNRWVNLRDANVEVNSRNMKKRKDNSSGTTGVYFRKDNSKWRVIVSNISIGQYDTYEEACSVRAEVAARLGYTERHGK
nr:MAG: zinc-binding loop region of homing endonuclease [Bacteriophage sp.]